MSILKPGKDCKDGANFRPILLNTDLKIMNKILATRLNTLLSRCIHPDQVGFLQHRQTHDQTRRIINIISAVHSKWDAMGDRCYMLLSLNLHKAFE